MKTFDIWSDGASNGKTGDPGGWAAVLRESGGTTIAISGSAPSTTNNRMELQAILEGLTALGLERVKVTVHTDSAYCKNPFTNKWIYKWQRTGWKSYGGDPVANRDLWEQLLALDRIHEIHWHKIRGHAGIPENEIADTMAVKAKKTGQGEMVIL